MEKLILLDPPPPFEAPLRDKTVDIFEKYLSIRLMNNTKIGVTPIFT